MTVRFRPASGQKKRRQARWTEIRRMPSGRDGGLTPRARPGRRSAARRSRSRQSGLFSALRARLFPAEEPALPPGGHAAPCGASHPRKSGRFSRVSRFRPTRMRLCRRFRSADPDAALGASSLVDRPSVPPPVGDDPHRPWPGSCPREEARRPPCGPARSRGNRLDRPPPRDPCGPRDDPGAPPAFLPATVASRRRRPASGLRAFRRAAFRVPPSSRYRLHDPPAAARAAITFVTSGSDFCA